MKSLGFNIDRGHLRFVVLQGTLTNPVFVERGREDHSPTLAVPERMDWYHKTFESLIANYSPDRVAYRMHWGGQMKQEQVATFHYPWGVLNLYCQERRLDVIETTSVGLTAKRFGLPKDSKPMDVCDQFIGNHPPHWDDAQRYAACAAWFALA